MERVKILNIDNLNNETLKSIVEFKLFRCDKVIINCNSKITSEEIYSKILELNKVYCSLIELIFTDNDVSYDKLKHDNEWFDVEVDNDNIIVKVVRNDSILNEVLLLLTSSDCIEELCDNIYDKFYKDILFWDKVTAQGSKLDINVNCKIEIKMY